MLNFSELILDILDEKGKTIKDLEENKIIGKNTFYSYSKNAPSLKTVIKILNFLETSIDYFLYKSSDNNFTKYKPNQQNFYINLQKFIKVPQAKLCKDLGISRSNFSRWSNGTLPTLSKLITLANYLNCNIDDLLEHE